MRIRSKDTPRRQAAKYLERIAALTGARHEYDGSYRLTARGERVHSGFKIRIYSVIARQIDVLLY